MNGTRICSFTDCDRSSNLARGLCRTHYSSARRAGELDLFPIKSAADRLASGLVPMQGGCIEWSRYTNPDGYGSIRVGPRMRGTHRLAWELANGTIPDGVEVCHRCDNPPCCNVEHLFLGTHAENIADRDAKGRCRAGSINNSNGTKTHCKRGHEFVPENTIIPARGRRICRKCETFRRSAQWRGVSVAKYLADRSPDEATHG